MPTKPRPIGNNTKQTLEMTIFSSRELEILWQKGMDLASNNYDHRMMMILAKMRDHIAKIDKNSRLALEGRLPEG
jgi:hypothetical protein